jgi:NDP-sugar pyrophosphorylase family protein
VVESLRDWHDDSITVEVCFDGPTLLGTAGAIKRAAPLLGEAFFVLYGDSYLTCDFRAVQRAYENSRKQALMTVFRNEGRWEHSNVEFRDGRILAYDKRATDPRMQHVDYGLGVVSGAALLRVPDDQPYDLALLYQRLLDGDQLAAFEVRDRFYEIGSFEGLEETRRLLSSASNG